MADLDGALRLLKCRSAGDRISAVLELGRLKSRAAVPALIDSLSDETIRALSCWALGRIQDASAVPSLLEMLADEDPKVRHEAVLALARIRDKRAAKPVSRLLLLDEEAKVREECAEALAAFPSQEAVSALKKAVASDSSKAVKEAANKSLVSIRLKELGVTASRE